eukprot:7072175-Prymnesium_polylepis.1
MCIRDSLYINTDTMSQGFIGVLLAIALVILAYECFFGEKVVHNFRVRNNVEGILALADTQQGDVADAKQGGAGGDTKASDEEDQPRPKWVKVCVAALRVLEPMPRVSSDSAPEAQR